MTKPQAGEFTELDAGKTFTSDRGVEYLVDGLIAQGGEARVFRVRSSEGDYALKQFGEGTEEWSVPPDVRFASDRSLLERVAQANNGSRVEGVVKLHDASERYMFLVLNRMACSLSDVLDEKEKLEPLDAAAIVGSVALTLDMILKLGVIHGDLKPENILLSGNARDYFSSSGDGSVSRLADVFESGSVQLTDFSLGYLDNISFPRMQARRGGLVLSTVPYTSPEILRGEISPKADSFSLGMIAYEMLEGKDFFSNIKDPETLLLILNNGGIPPLNECIREILGGFASVVHYAVSKNPKTRPTANEFLEEAKDVLCRHGINLKAVLKPKQAAVQNVIVTPTTASPLYH